MTFLLSFFKNFWEHGFDAFNDLFPKVSEYSDVYCERVKTLFLFMSTFSIVMMFSDPDGFLYSTFLMPFSANILLLHRVPFPPNPTPESGMHWTTILTYSHIAYNYFIQMEHDKIKKSFHKIVLIFMIFIIGMYFPFELVYISLYDIFHNIPIYGYPAIWAYGWWKTGLDYIIHSVIGVDVGIPILCITIIYTIKKDLAKNFRKIFNWNRKTKLYLALYIISTISWILIPLYHDVPEYGTKWFPQTIYVKYDYYENYPEIEYTSENPYGIVEEYWEPSDIIKIHNVVSKYFSCLFVFNLLIPHSIKRNDNNEE